MWMLLALLALTSADGAWWDVTFTPHSEAVAVSVTTNCRGKVAFFEYQEVPITEIGQDHIRIPRARIPAGARCNVMVAVLISHDNGRHEEFGESVQLIQEDR